MITMNKNKITPALWFHTGDGKISDIINYYQTIFASDMQCEPIIPLGDTPSGYAEMTTIELYGQKYSMMSTAMKHNEFNDALSFIITCADQDEIDKFWNYFTKDGQEVQCGWCIDKHGLRWQIIPNNLSELLSLPGGFEVMMKQKRIVIAEYDK